MSTIFSVWQMFASKNATKLKHGQDYVTATERYTTYILHLDTYYIKGSCVKNHSNIDIKPFSIMPWLSSIDGAHLAKRDIKPLCPSQYSSKLSIPAKWWNSLEKSFTEEFHCLPFVPGPAAGDGESCLLRLKTVSLFSWTSGTLACLVHTVVVIVGT